MIKSLTLKMFKIHHNTTLNFAKGLNVIRGESDNGKSALFGGIRWVTENTPTGDSFRTKGKSDEDTEVILEFDNGTVTRFRNNRDNYYTLNGEEYRAMRSDVPVEIADFINFSGVNIQTQFQPFFLLSESPGEVARRLNSIVGLDIIDKAQKKINSLTTETKGDIKQSESLIETYEYELSKCRGLEAADIRLTSLENSIEDFQKLKADYKVLEHSVSAILDKKEKLKELKKTLQLEDSVNGILRVYDSIMDTKKKAKNLQSIIKSISDKEEALNRVEALLVMEEEVTRMWNALQGIQEKSDLIDSLRDVISDIQKEEKKVKKSQKDIEKFMDSYEQKMVDLGTCPLCGNVVSQ